MSRIITPNPPPLNSEIRRSAKPDHSWWRLRLLPNEEGNLAIMQALPPGSDFDNAKALSYEFFDGYDDIIDAGFDKPIGAVRITYHERIGDWIDILSINPPSQSPLWQQITLPGEPHPDDRRREHHT
ncbi:MAG: hypothetical protein K2X00_24070 [Nitrospiraceae bacterium]|nr:hypothetical protein [Nitrospiraceae bacterium]